MAGLDQGKAAPHRRVGLREFRDNITGFLRQARNGSSFLITSHGEVVAEIRPPPEPERPRRRPGALRGKIQMAPDFDILPLKMAPDFDILHLKVLSAMEDEEE